MKNKKGISLIVLIITIIVVIILAAVVILTLSKNNPIESAKEARFKEDVRTFKDELALYISKQYTNAGGHRDDKITTSDFDEIQGYIPSFSEKYRDKFVIKDDELVYTTKLDEKEKEYAQSLNINEKSLLPDEYQQIEYIESTGTQYIDTKYKLSGNLKFNGKILINEDTKEMAIIGNDLSNNCQIEIGFSNNKFFTYCNNNSARIIPTESLYNKIIEFESEYSSNKPNKRSILNIDNKKYECTSDEENGMYSNSNLLLLCVYNSYFFSGRVYVLDFFINEQLICNFIPCYRKLDNEIGLYDTINDEFYTNQGTGDDFIPGPDVN